MAKPLRICFIMYQGNMYSGGQGVYLHYVTRELVRLGHEVHVISGRPYPRLDAGVVHHRLHTYSFWAFLNGRDEHVFDHDHNPAAFFHPWNFYEFASTRASLASLFFTFSVRAYQKLAEIEAALRAAGIADIDAVDQHLGLIGIGAAQEHGSHPARPPGPEIGSPPSATLWP